MSSNIIQLQLSWINSTQSLHNVSKKTKTFSLQSDKHLPKMREGKKKNPLSLSVPVPSVPRRTTTFEMLSCFHRGAHTPQRVFILRSLWQRL